MASLRGGQKLWTAKSIAQNDVSALANIGPGPYVTLYIDNEGATTATFDVEVSTTSSTEAGRNAIDGTADGGLSWYLLTAHSAIAVAAGKKVAIDLAPFSPQYLRLKRTDATGACVVTALVSAFGAN